MAFLVKKPTSGGNFKMMPEGFNDAVVSRVEDKGEQPNPFYEQNVAAAKKKGEDPSRIKKSVQKCLIVYTNADGEEVGEMLTVSLHDKATLAKRVKTLTGSAPGVEFDLEQLQGIPVTVQVEHYIKQNGYDGAKVIAVALRRKSAARATSVSQSVAARSVNDNDPITDDDIPF